jgi:hypothetical protein
MELLSDPADLSSDRTWVIDRPDELLNYLY